MQCYVRVWYEEVTPFYIIWQGVLRAAQEDWGNGEGGAVGCGFLEPRGVGISDGGRHLLLFR